MNFPIVTKNLIIRRFESGDLLPFLKFMGNSDSTKYLAFEKSQKTEAGAKSLFEYVCAAYDSEQPVHSYAIANRQSNQYLGSCGFAPYKEGIVECYYSVNAEHCGRGIATEATTALVAILSRKYEVRAYCHQDNHAAHAVATNSGFHSEGMALHENFGFQGLLFVYPKRS
ncbi:GNAT family N-acetyltransferase [Pleurocapsales cyanobacterium LEGE 10410]|nr:GNAT family N-acetyltransferase [Pleurocapsales cyanobacterium LEGE 10410]